MIRLGRFLLLVIALYCFEGNGMAHDAQPKINASGASKQTQLLQSLHGWIAHDLYLIKNTTGYSPPVAARTLYYISVANYESIYPKVGKLESMSDQLAGYKRPELSTEDLAWEHVLNLMNLKLTTHFFVNMSPRDLGSTTAKYENAKEGYAPLYSAEELKNADAYVEVLFASIISWSDLDGAKEAWNKNFPKSFEPQICDSCWESTLPGYERALQPYWGSTRLAIASNEHISDTIGYVPFSKNSTSNYYKEVQRILNCYDSLTQNEITIAKYWNDAPGVSGTPVGHLFAIANSLAISEHLPLEKSICLYLLLGTAVNDAMIECWELKYMYSAIRPITYIHRYLELPFVPILITPPFPEFPSGHSYQAGSAQAVFEYIFGSELKFWDVTNSERPDINGSPRMYNSFHEMSQEMSVSRFYGGIHYLSTLQQSLKFGYYIGENKIKSIEFKK